MNYKTLIGLLFLFAIPMASEAQTLVGYSYDAAGNRVKREIVLSQDSRQRSHFTDVSKAYTLSVSPNPTQGILHIESQDLCDTECEITVYNVSGNPICKTTMFNGNANIDLSQKDNGTYLMTIIAKGTKRSWKILKR